MKVLNNISLIDRKQWVALVNRSPVASIFQTPDIFDFFIENELYDIKILGVEEDCVLKGLVVCVIQSEGKRLKKLLTTRAIINGGPLLDDSISDDALKLLLCSVLSELKKQCIYIETRNLNDYSRWRKTFEACGFEYQPHYNFHIDTSEIEIEKGFDKSRRKRIRRALENGAVINSDNACLPSFYGILSDLYRNKIHKPLPPYEMFESLLKCPFAKYFYVLSPQRKVIGGQLILLLGNRVVYAWYCCGLDQEYRELHPSIMANYAAIRFASDQGFGRYDMMGAGEPGDHYGVRDFKAQFGGTLVEHGRFRRINNAIVYNLGRLAISVLDSLKK